MSTKRGMIIVFEGLDRVGKSTQAAQLVQSLNKQGFKTELIRFPDRSTLIGGQINQYLSGQTKLDDHVIHLLFTTNRWERFNHMLELLKSGTNLVVDRYSFSGVAYSAAKGLDLSWCKTVETGLIKPDCVIFLTNDFEELEKRENFGGEIYEKREFQLSVFKKYLELKDSYWKLINTRKKSIDEVHKEILEIIGQCQKNLSPNIDYLW